MIWSDKCNPAPPPVEPPVDPPPDPPAPLPDIDFCANPRPAYATAAPVCTQFEPPCEVANSGDIPDVPPVDPGVLEPLTPDCVALTYATNSNEVLQEFEYNSSTGRYDAIDEDPGNPSEAFLSFNQTFGWSVSTGNALYTSSQPNTSPYNVYCNNSNEAVTIIPCDKAVFPETPTEPGPEIVYEDCVEVIRYSDTNETPQQFFYNINTARYVAPNGDEIKLNQSSGLWELTTSIRTYTIAALTEQASGAYNSIDNQNASVGPCGDTQPPVVGCVQSVYADDASITLGEFNVDGNLQLQPTDPLQGTLVFNPQVGWIYTPDGGPPYQGGTVQTDPRGLYTALNGQCVLFKDCA